MPYCRKARQFFEANGIQYIEKNVNDSRVAAKEMAELGGSGVPTILIDNEVIYGWDEPKLRASLL